MKNLGGDGAHNPSRLPETGADGMPVKLENSCANVEKAS